MNYFANAGWELGSGVARIAKSIEQGLGYVGWPTSCFTFAVFLADATQPGMGAVYDLFRELLFLALWGAVFFASIRLRGLSRWISEVGFKIGLWSALGFGVISLGIWLSAPNTRGTLMYGTAFILSTQFSAGLCAFAAWRDWEKVESAVIEFRRYLNGAKDDGGWSVFQTALEPLPWLVLSLFAIAAAIFPERVVLSVWSGYGGMTPVLMTHLFWVVVATLPLARLYVAFRRVGQGNVERGVYLWLYTAGGFAAGIIICVSLYTQLRPGDMNGRVVACAFAFAAASLAWFCERRRRGLVGT